jgi:hypothetical protein
MGKFILKEEERKSIRGLYGIINEQSSETVSIIGEQPYPGETITIEGTTLNQFRDNVKSKTGDISIDESSVNFSYTNNVFKVSYSTGETKIAGMTLVWSDINREELDVRIESKMKKGLYPNLIQKKEWKGESGNYYYEFLILIK